MCFIKYHFFYSFYWQVLSVQAILNTLMPLINKGIYIMYYISLTFINYINN